MKKIFLFLVFTSALEYTSLVQAMEGPQFSNWAPPADTAPTNYVKMQDVEHVVVPQESSQSPFDADFWHNFMSSTPEEFHQVQIGSNGCALLKQVSIKAFNCIQGNLLQSNTQKLLTTRDELFVLLENYSGTIHHAIGLFSKSDFKTYLHQSQTLYNILSSLGNLLEHSLLWRTIEPSKQAEFYAIIGQSKHIAAKARCSMDQNKYQESKKQYYHEYFNQKKQTQKQNTSSKSLLTLTNEYVQSNFDKNLNNDRELLMHLSKQTYYHALPFKNQLPNECAYLFKSIQPAEKQDPRFSLVLGNIIYNILIQVEAIPQSTSENCDRYLNALYCISGQIAVINARTENQKRKDLNINSHPSQPPVQNTSNDLTPPPECILS